MKFYRIQALLMRYTLQLRDANRLFEMTLWPAFDALVGSIVSLWMARDTNLQQAALIPLFGIFFWQVATRAYTDLGANTLEDIWSKNISNLFASPLMYSEWLIALMLFALLRALWVLVLCGAVIYCCFGISLGMFGWWLVPLVSILLMTGFGCGCFGAAAALLWGSRAMSLVFSFWILIPVCGVLYPLNVVPYWMQIIGHTIPMTYVFSAVQQFITAGVMPVSQLCTGALLSVVYVIVGSICCKWALASTKNAGLARLEAE